MVVYYFKKYLEQAPLSLAIWRALEAEELSKFKIKKPILDIGCGFGEFAGVFFESIVEAGVDINQKDLVIAAKKKKYKKLLRVDARNMPFKNKSFNSVISISSLEHIDGGVESVFKDVHRILKDNGLFIFSVPTEVINKNLVLPYPKWFWLKIYHLVFKHKLIISKKAWLQMTKKAGFEVVSVKGILSKKQLIWFEIGLISALPSQILRALFGRRFVYAVGLKTKALVTLLKDVLNDKNSSDSNIMIVARKR